MWVTIGRQDNSNSQRKVVKVKHETSRVSYSSLLYKNKRTCQSVYLKCQFVFLFFSFFFFDKLKCEIRNKVLLFVSILKLRHKARSEIAFQFSKKMDIEIQI